MKELKKEKSFFSFELKIIGTLLSQLYNNLVYVK